jgi:hypothetical protein
MKVSERKFKVEVPISPPWSPYSRCMIDRFRVIAIAPERLRPQPPGYDGDVGHICSPDAGPFLLRCQPAHFVQDITLQSEVEQLQNCVARAPQVSMLQTASTVYGGLDDERDDDTLVIVV